MNQKMMHEPIGIPAYFSINEKHPLDHDLPPPSPSLTPLIPTTTTTTTTLTRSGSGSSSPQSLIMSVYRTKIGSQSRLVTITWCKNLLLHGLSVSVDGSEGEDHYHCKVELKPWYFWRKQGSKNFVVDGKIIGIVWDLKAAKFNGEVEPQSDYYVAIVSEDEVVLVVGDMKKAAFRKTGCRPALIDPVLVSRKEHIFGKKKFSTRVKFHERGKNHEISVECINNNSSKGDYFEGIMSLSPQMEIKIDGELVTHVKHLQWKFRGNDTIEVKDTKLEVYWDVHDWIFGSGPRNAMFLFKSSSLTSGSGSGSGSGSISPPPLLSPMSSSSSLTSFHANDLEDFSLFLYAWKVE